MEGEVNDSSIYGRDLLEILDIAWSVVTQLDVTGELCSDMIM